MPHQRFDVARACVYSRTNVRSSNDDQNYRREEEKSTKKAVKHKMHTMMTRWLEIRVFGFLIPIRHTHTHIQVNIWNGMQRLYNTCLLLTKMPEKESQGDMKKSRKGIKQMGR